MLRFCSIFRLALLGKRHLAKPKNTFKFLEILRTMHFLPLKSGIWNKNLWPIGKLNEFRLWSQFVALTEKCPTYTLWSKWAIQKDPETAWIQDNTWIRGRCVLQQRQRGNGVVEWRWLRGNRVGGLTLYGGSWKVFHRGCSLGEGAINLTA